nr:DUF2255 family protein [Streptomyces mexicanus]
MRKPTTIWVVTDGSLRKPTTIWVVTDGDQVFVRSWRGTDGAWWKTARTTGTGHISVGRIDTDVSFTPVTDPAANDRVDGAYRAKYGRYPGRLRRTHDRRAGPRHHPAADPEDLTRSTRKPETSP